MKWFAVPFSREWYWASLNWTSSWGNKLRTVVWLAQGLTASRWQRQDSTTDISGPKALSWAFQYFVWPSHANYADLGGGKQLHPEKAMAPHSSTLAWKIPWVEEPGGLQSVGSLGVGHNWGTSLSLFTFMHWRRKWQHTPVFLPGGSQGWGSLVDCRLWGHTELDTTEAT